MIMSVVKDPLGNKGLKIRIGDALGDVILSLEKYGISNGSYELETREKEQVKNTVEYIEKALKVYKNIADGEKDNAYGLGSPEFVDNVISGASEAYDVVSAVVAELNIDEPKIAAYKSALDTFSEGQLNVENVDEIQEFVLEVMKSWNDKESMHRIMESEHSSRSFLIQKITGYAFAH